MPPTSPTPRASDRPLPRRGGASERKSERAAPRESPGARPAPLSPAPRGGYNNAVPQGRQGSVTVPLTAESPMRKMWRAVCAVGLLLTLGGPLWSGDESAARAVIDKGIEAQGGAAKLAKFHSAILKGTGKLYFGSKDGLPLTGELTTQGAERMRTRLTLRPKDVKDPIVITIVVNGSQGWKKV